MGKLRLAEIVSHPIQVRVPYYRCLAAMPDVDFTVLYVTDHGVKPSYDAGYGKTIRYDLPLLEGYSYRFVPNISPRPDPIMLTGAVNPSLVRLLVRERYDALHVHGWAQIAHLTALATARAIGTPYMVSCDGNLLGPSVPFPVHVAKQLFLGTLVRQAGALLCAGIENTRFWESYGARSDQLFPAPYPADNALIGQLADQARASGLSRKLRALAGATDDDLVVVNCSKLQETRKRMSVLVEALRLLPPNVVAVFVGEGADRAELEAHIRTAGVRAYITGFVNQMEIPAWYAAGDVLSVSSEIEPWGVVTNEAMAAGLPVVASDRVGAALDLVVPGHTGDIYPCGDPRALADTLRTLMDRSLRNRLAVQARERVARHSPQKTAEGIVAAAKRISSDRSRRDP